MAYLVRVLPRAERDFANIYQSINAEHSDSAFRWFRGLELPIFSLEESPRRCAITPEDKTLRHLLYGNKPHVYRIIYRIVERRKEVEILHIRHCVMDKFNPGEL